jgi:hypothetical protein
VRDLENSPSPVRERRVRDRGVRDLENSLSPAGEKRDLENSLSRREREGVRGISSLSSRPPASCT